MIASTDTFAGPQSARAHDLTLEARIAVEARRAEERRRWLGALLTKLRSGRAADLTPEEFGWLVAKLVVDA